MERTLLVAKVEVSAHYLGLETDLSANEFMGGAISGQGFVHLESFRLEDGMPTWRYAIGDALLETRIFMAPEANTSYLRVELLRATAPLRVTLKPLVTYRDYHSQGRGAQPLQLETAPGGCRVQAFPGARPYRLSITQGEFTPAAVWYWNFLHRREAERGLDALEDLLTPGSFTVDLALRQPVFLTATAEAAAAPGPEVESVLKGAAQRLLAPLPRSAPAWIRSLARASDQFIVRRDVAGSAARSVIAGYPWFTDWGRDTMISLPGLATSLKRYDLAAGILRTYARFVDRGMLPNCFPDVGAAPQYNTADATLWMFHALDDYLEAHRDPDLTARTVPHLDERHSCARGGNALWDRRGSQGWAAARRRSRAPSLPGWMPSTASRCSRRESASRWKSMRCG